MITDCFDAFIFQLAQQSFKDALGDGIWITLLDNKVNTCAVDASASIFKYKYTQLFHQLEEDGRTVELPWNKVTVLFNLARLLEQLHNSEAASILYHLILYKVGMYVLRHLLCP